MKITAKRLGLASVATLALCGIPFSASHALGLGKIESSSHLGQPLNAYIPLLGVTSEEVANVNAGLATEEDFLRLDVPHTGLAELRFNLVQDANGQYAIAVTTAASFVEPFLRFVIDVKGSGDRVVREYVLLVDPPPAFPLEQPVEPVVVRDITPRAETPQALRPILAPEHDAPSAALSYGPVKRNDTLWVIADQMRPADISVEQMMVALFNENPQAFIEGNVNLIKQGAMLSIEDARVLAQLPQTQAQQEIRRHYQEWLKYRRELAEKRGASAERSIAASAPTTEPQSRLELAAPDDSGAAASRTSTPTEPVTVEEVVSSALVDAQVQNEILRDQVSRLEQRVAELNGALAEREQALEVMRDAPQDASLEPPTAAGGEASPLSETPQEVMVTPPHAAASVAAEPVAPRVPYTHQLLVMALSATGVLVASLAAIIFIMYRNSRKVESEFRRRLLPEDAHARRPAIVPKEKPEKMGGKDESVVEFTSRKSSETSQ